MACASAVARRLEWPAIFRSEEHTSELQSLRHLVCRLLLEKKIQNPTSGRAHRPAPRRSSSDEHTFATRRSCDRERCVHECVDVAWENLFLFFFFNDTATTEIYTSFPTRRSSDLYPADSAGQYHCVGTTGTRIDPGVPHAGGLVSMWGSLSRLRTRFPDRKSAVEAK